MREIATGGPGDIVLLVADAQRARIVRATGGHALDVVWEGYAPTRAVHALGQSPDITKNSEDFPREGVADRVDRTAQFARDVAEHVRGIVRERAAERLVIITPRSFASELEAGLGDAWPSRQGDVVYRDETDLDDEALGRVIDASFN